MMMGVVTWHNVLFLFSIYSVFIGSIARLLKLGHVLGIVFGIALLLAWLTRTVAFAILPVLPPSVAVLSAFAALILTNFIVDFRAR